MARKLQITLELPDEVAARLQESVVGESLKYETRRTIEAPVSVRVTQPPITRVITVLLLLGLFGAGAVMGYVMAAGYVAYADFAERLRPAPSLEPDRAASATQQPSPTRTSAPVTIAAPARSATPPAPLTPSITAPSARPIQSAGGSSGSGKASSPIVYRVQVGAFRFQQNAEDLIKDLQRDGFKAFAKRSGGLHMVYVGLFFDRQEAEALAKELKAKRYGAFIVRVESSRR